ncbi:helix-turn-helix domain-containing protein [Pseudomonas oryzihabitans]|uniref:helix-turn-helix domain-containing protein n=1 Tax=Pseudomonas oryzihabitans TaxID=47885 RepID=UPI002893CFF8|nr:helix-turn-helix domain-containing protein [Pseudomonas oryzihabitans]MDT3718481.1 hypothetical protein [Pseudomonas oryzihabitans]
MSRPAIHKARVIEMLLAGVAPREIMQVTGCSEYTVLNYRRRLNLPPFSQGGRPRKTA